MKRIYFMVILAVVMLPLAVIAEKPVSLKINEIPGPEQIRTTKSVHIGEYSGSGVIDYIDDSRIVINDASFDLFSRIRVEDLQGDYYSKKLNKGMYIYYFLDGKRKISKIVIEQ